MRKIAMALLLLVMSAGASAEWVKVASSDDGNITYYADPATIRKVGDKVRVWTLTDYKTSNVAGGDQQYLSTKVQEEFDCAKETARHLNLSAFSGNMGAGKEVGREKNPAKWHPVVHESIGEDVWKFACGKT